MAAKTHYEVLGLPPTATLAEVRAAYRRLARQLHPDKSPGTTREFQEVSQGACRAGRCGGHGPQ
jgi:curved DNA-binding protein CbpA